MSKIATALALIDFIDKAFFGGEVLGRQTLREDTLDLCVLIVEGCSNTKVNQYFQSLSAIHKKPIEALYGYIGLEFFEVKRYDYANKYLLKALTEGTFSKSDQTALEEKLVQSVALQDYRR